MGHMGMGVIIQTPILNMLGSIEDSEGSTVALCIDGVVSTLEH
jgi:hypothetical protein